MSGRCAVAEPLQAFFNDARFTEVPENDRIVLEESNAVLDRCRARCGRRTRNKIALIQPRKGGRPSFGLLYVGAYLLDNHFEVKVFEFLDELYPPNIRYNKRTWKELFAFNPGFIGFSVLSSTVKIVHRQIEEIRKHKPDTVIVCGGKHVASNPGDLLFHDADFCVVGEAEITIVELLDALNFHAPVHEIKGIAYLKDDKVCQTPMRPFLPLDYIYRPAFELVDYEKYVDFRFQGIPGHYLKTGFIFGSRGCPYKCKFCTSRIRGSYRERSVDHLIDEMEWQISNYHVEGFVILDDLFYFKESRILEFCNKLIERKIDTKFFCHARVNIVKKSTVEMMKKAGVLLVGLGVESGSQKILDAMNKHITVEQIELAFDLYNEAGINTFAFIIVGHPDETDEDRELTRTLLKRIKPTHVPVSYYMPMPGTPSYDFEIQKARYLLNGKDFQGFSYITDDPEFSTTVSLEELKKIGNEFEGLSVVNRNKNLFTYPAFIFFLTKFLIFHPFVILEGLFLRYVIHKTHQMSLLAVLKDAIQFHKQKFQR